MKRNMSIAIFLTLMLAAADLTIGSNLEIAGAVAITALTADNSSLTGIITSKSEVLLAQQPCRKCPDSPYPRVPDVDPLIPYIISPRRTLLLNASPALRWNAVPRATRYTVRVVSEQGEIWKTEVNGTEVVYAGKTLQPGVDYLVIVEADNGKSSQEEDVPGREFSLLNANDIQLVRLAIELLDKQQLTDETKTLFLTYLYIGYYLRAEAIEKLEVLVKGGNQTPVVYRLLGTLYQQVGLSVLSESRYLQAVKLATAAKDLESQAVAQAGLAEIYAARGNKEEAVRWLTQALTTYKRLGDTQRVRELERRLEELKR